MYGDSDTPTPIGTMHKSTSTFIASSPCEPGSGHFFEPFRHPDLDYGLPRHPKALCFLIQLVNHPQREINIHPLLLLLWSMGLGDIEVAGNILVVIEFFIKLFSLHIYRPHDLRTPANSRRKSQWRWVAWYSWTTKRGIKYGVVSGKSFLDEL